MCVDVRKVSRKLVFLTKKRIVNKPSLTGFSPSSVIIWVVAASCKRFGLLRWYLINSPHRYWYAGTVSDSALLAARSVKIIYFEREKNRNTASKYKLFIHKSSIQDVIIYSWCNSVLVWCGPGSFWAPPANIKPTSRDDQTVCLLCFEWFFWLNLIFSCW